MSHPPDDDPARRYAGALAPVDAAHRRERDRRRYGLRRGRGTWIWWAITVVGLALFVLLMHLVMEKTKWTAGDVAMSTHTAHRRN